MQTIYRSILFVFVVLSETRYDQYNYFWYYRPTVIDPFTLNPIYMIRNVNYT